MSRIRIHTRSFHPGKTFGKTGLGFSGDDRGFSLAVAGVTARIRHYMDIDLTRSRIIDYRPISDPSHHEGMGTIQTYGDPNKQPTSVVTGSCSLFRKDGDQSFEATVSYKGKNYAFPGADWERRFEIGEKYEVSISPRHGMRRTVPDLDVTNQISGYIDRTTGWLHLTCNLRGDGFPNCETFAVTAGETLALCTHIRVGVAAAQLFGDRRIPMGHTMIDAQVDSSDVLSDMVDIKSSVDYAGDGSPVDLLGPHGPMMARVVWNNIHTSRDALGPPERREMDNSFWRGIRERFRG